MNRAVVAAALVLGACATSPTPISPPAISSGSTGLRFGDVSFGKADIVSAEMGFSPNGMPLVNVTLSPDAKSRLYDLTRANVGNQLPLLVDGIVLSNPKVMEPIEGGQFQVSGNFSVAEAQAIAARILGKKRK